MFFKFKRFSCPICLIWLFLFFSAPFFPACKKSNDEQIPFVSVDFTIYVTDPKYSSLAVTGGWAYANHGSRGIIIFRKSTEEFGIYDRHCTYKPSEPCGLVSVDPNGVFGVDTCCGSKFLLYDGSVNNGPAAMPLKKYQNSFDGSKLHVFN